MVIRVELRSPSSDSPERRDRHLSSWSRNSSNDMLPATYRMKIAVAKAKKGEVRKLVEAGTLPALVLASLVGQEEEP